MKTIDEKHKDYQKYVDLVGSIRGAKITRLLKYNYSGKAYSEELLFFIGLKICVANHYVPFETKQFKKVCHERYVFTLLETKTEIEEHISEKLDYCVKVWQNGNKAKAVHLENLINFCDCNDISVFIPSAVLKAKMAYAKYPESAVA